MERVDNITQLSHVEQQRHYSKVRETVAKKLKLIQEVYGKFQTTGQGSSPLMREVKEKGFTRMINEYDAHLMHLDKKLNALKIIITNQYNGRKQKNKSTQR